MHFDVFWSFRSPYSYLATRRLVGIAADYDVEVRVRPVLPIAVRIPGFDLGNSPREYTAKRCRGTTLVLTTSNGTRALLRLPV